MLDNPADYILLAGWQLCIIEPGSKGPQYKGWNDPANAITDPAIAEVCTGVGILHALSGTCAVDIDDMKLATAWCEQRGIMLPTYLKAPDAVQILSGVPGRGKLLYRLEKPLQTIKPKGCGIELRCATVDGKSMQDALPPTIHPIRKKPYTWLGDWTRLPALPAPIWHAWRESISSAPPETLPASPPSQQGPADIEHLRSLIRGRDPSCGYDEWIKVGMQLHDKTRGDGQGLAIWNEWSSKGRNYKGIGDLQLHWRSFRLDHPRPVTADGLERMSAAVPDEFDVVDPAQQNNLEAADPNNLTPIQQLQRRLVFVRNQHRYYDQQLETFIPGGEALYHSFAYMFPKEKRKRVDVAKRLAETAGRVEADAAAFFPGEGQLFIDGPWTFLNTWRDALPEPIEPTADEIAVIEWLRARIDDEVFAKYLWQFFAHIVQKPHIKIRSAPLIWSEIQGNGKSTMMSVIPRRLVTDRHSQEVSFNAMEEKFNGFMLSKWHLCMTELKVGSRKEADAVMTRIKPWITDDHIEVRAMRTDAIDVPNHLVITATSNQPNALLIDEYDRRFAIHELKAPKMTDAEGKWVNAFLKGPRAAGALRHYFQRVDISDFRPDAPAPETQARAEMIHQSRGDDYLDIEVAMIKGEGCFQRDCGELRDIQRDMKARLSRIVPTQRIAQILRQMGAQMRRISHPRAGDARIWIWRNYDRWQQAGQKELMEYVDSGFAGE